MTGVQTCALPISKMNDWLGGSDAAGAERATKAMLGMRKIDLATMEAAYLSNS